MNVVVVTHRCRVYNDQHSVGPCKVDEHIRGQPLMLLVYPAQAGSLFYSL